MYCALLAVIIISRALRAAVASTLFHYGSHCECVHLSGEPFINYIMQSKFHVFNEYSVFNTIFVRN